MTRTQGDIMDRIWDSLVVLLVLVVGVLALVGCSEQHKVVTEWATVVGPTPSTLIEVQRSEDEALRAVFTDEMTADTVTVTIHTDTGFTFDAENLDINRSAILEQVESELVKTLRQIEELK